MLRAFTLALFAVLLWGPRSALSAPKTIAIVNLSEAEGSSEAAARVRKTLASIEDLRPSTPGDLARALEGPLPSQSPHEMVLAEARKALEAAEQAFTAFKSRNASAELDRARALLFSLPPTEMSTKMLADLSFRMALLHLRDENRGLAMGELQLLHRLDERTTIDPVRYPPDVVRAFKSALMQAPSEKSATITVSADYDGAPVFVDGTSVGASPMTIKVTPGVHIVSIAAPQYQATARTVEMDAGGKQSIQFALLPRLPVTLAQELRFEAKEEGLRDEDLRRAASRVSRLVGSDAVLVIRASSSGPEAALYIQHLDRLSFSRPVEEGFASMLGLVLDVPRPAIFDGSTKPSIVPWYKRPLVVGAIGGSLTLAVAALLSLSTSEDIQPDRLGVPQFQF